MFRRCATLSVLLLASLSARPLPSQAVAERDSLTLFRDSLSIVPDTVSLLAFEARSIAHARQHRDDAMVHLRLGFLALRIGQLAGRTKHVEDAAGEFEWASELQPAWPWTWFGLGLAEAALPDRSRSFAGGLYTMLGIDRDNRAGAAFLQSIRVDPTFVDGVLAFSEGARDQRIDAPLGAALAAMRTVMASPVAWQPQLLLEWGRLERVAGSADSACIAFERARLLGVDYAMADLELARTLPLIGDTVPFTAGGPTPVEVAYYAGAVSDDSEVVAGYRHDIQPIVPDTALATFDHLSGAARVAWLRTFWRDAGAADLRSSASRLAEHFRRWNSVTTLFRLPPFRRSYEWGIEAYHSGDQDIDDRGIVLLRQGAPSDRIAWPTYPQTASLSSISAPGGLRMASGVSSRGQGRRMFDALAVMDSNNFGTETWRYARPDGDLVLHFVAREDPADYRLVESIFDLGLSPEVMLARSRRLPGLQQILTAGPMSQVNLAAEERIRGRQSIAIATTTSSWTRTYRITLGGRVQWLAAGVRDGKPLVHIVYAVDAAMVRALSARDTSRMIRFEARAAILDKAGNAVATLDTVQFVPRPPPGARLIAMHAEMVAVPGAAHVRFGVELNPLVGAVYPLDSLTVPDIAGDTLALSSLLVGVAGKSLPWAAGVHDTAWLDAAHLYSPRDTLAVYFQAYGAEAGAPYTMRIAVTRQRNALERLITGRHDAIALTEQLQFNRRTGTVARAIDLAGLERGTYLLEVVLERGKQREVRRRMITVQ